MAAFGVHHEWGKLREVVIGISPAEDFVIFHEDSQRWLLPPADEFCRKHAGRRLIDIDAERARTNRAPSARPWPSWSGARA